MYRFFYQRLYLATCFFCFFFIDKKKVSVIHENLRICRPSCLRIMAGEWAGRRRDVAIELLQRFPFVWL